MSKLILVVEDQPDSRRIIRDMLAPTDYEIIEAEDGEQALAACRKTAARPHSDGYSATDHGRLHRHAPDQSRSRAAIDPDRRSHLLCTQRRGEDRELRSSRIDRQKSGPVTKSP